MSWTAISDFAVDDGAFAQDVNEIKDNIIALARCKGLGRHLGGSLIASLTKSASVQDAVDADEVEFDGTDISGLTAEVEVMCYTENAATSVTPQLYNVTDATVAGTGSASTNTSPTRQTFPVTLASGNKVYRLRATNSNTTHFTYVKGSVRIYASA